MSHLIKNKTNNVSIEKGDDIEYIKKLEHNISNIYTNIFTKLIYTSFK